MREIITDWTLPGSSTAATVMYWRESPPTAAQQRTSLATFWAAIDNMLDNAATWTIRTEGRLVDEVTGTLTGAWTEPTVHTGTGIGTGEPVADATQALIRWNTSTIHGGRFIKGRTFVPGLATTTLLGGNLAPAQVTSMNSAAAAMLAEGWGLGVWSRPKTLPPVRDGLWAAAGSADTWSELAVLRKRRG